MTARRIESKTCVVVLCTDCGKPFGDEDEGSIQHFDSEDEAVKVAADCGWLVTAEVAVCWACVAARECALLDHEWGAWIPLSSASIRYCDRCRAKERAPSGSPTEGDKR